MDNTMEQFEKFIEAEKAQVKEMPTEAPIEFVDNVIYVDFKAKCRIIF